jgi:hypothetical protein
MKRGTATITQRELLDAIQKEISGEPAVLSPNQMLNQKKDPA